MELDECLCSHESRPKSDSVVGEYIFLKMNMGKGIEYAAQYIGSCLENSRLYHAASIYWKLEEVCRRDGLVG